METALRPLSLRVVRRLCVREAWIASEGQASGGLAVISWRGRKMGLFTGTPCGRLGNNCDMMMA